LINPVRFVLLALVLLPTIHTGAYPAVNQRAPQLPGNEEPGSVPTLLAPGFINTGLVTRDVAMTPDGREIYFCQATGGYGYGAILVTRFEDGRWSAPEVASFSGDPDWVDLEPFISPDGKRLFFYSSRPVNEEDQSGAQDIWVMDRMGDSWGEPRNVGAPVNSSEPEYFPTVTTDGTLYFCRADSKTRVHTLYRSALVDGHYQEPEPLPEQANTGRNRFNAWMSPDQKRMIIPAAGHPDNLGGVDYWLALRSEGDVWTGPFNLGPLVNDGSPGSWSPYVSPDRQTFFFMSGRTLGHPQPWPESWSGLQWRHDNPGNGRSGIFVMNAAFLEDVAAGSYSPVETDESLETSPGLKPDSAWPRLHGPYLGQKHPGLVPEIFAPGLISTGLNERDIVISPDGESIYFGLMDLGLVTVMNTQLVDGLWTEPATVGFHENTDFACFEPTLSRDGTKVCFLSNQAAPGQEQGRGWANQNIFTSQLSEGHWSPPEALAAPVTSQAAEYFPSLAADGTLYFSREDSLGHPFLWAAEPEGEGYAEPKRLPAAVNIGTSCYNAFVALDESFIISCVSGHEENLGPADYWISFADDNGFWLPAKNLGEVFNGPDSRASSAFMSSDGAYLFFSSSRAQEFSGTRLTRADLHDIHASWGNGAGDIWWVSAGILDKFRPGQSQ